MAKRETSTALALLKDLQDSINRLHTNFKKTSQSRYSLSYLETRIELLEDYWAQVRTEHRNILAQESLTKEDRNSCNDICNQIEDSYLDLKTGLKEKIHQINKLEKSVATPVNTNSISKLPTINLPTFAGNYRDWIYFRDMFSSLVDNDQGLSEIQKHHYLRSSLKGEAEQLLRHLDVTAANYTIAWKTLINRYSNPRIIVNTILSRLLGQKKLTKECPKGLKELIDRTNECLNSLSNININTTSWDPLIVHIVVSRLDIESHKSWEQSLGSSTELPSYQQLCSFIEGRFRAIEMVQTSQKKEFNYQVQPSTQKTTNFKSFATETETECTYCTKGHYLCHCTDFAQLDVDQRRTFVKSNNLCFNCLVKGHSIKNCRQNTACRTCKRKHHTLLHQNQFIAKAVITPEEESDNSDPEAEITSMKVATGSHLVVLATARLGVKDKNGVITYLRALVDQGSQATFMTESAVQLLGLKKTKFEANVTGIGNNAVKSRYTVLLDIYSPIDSQYVMQVQAHVLTKLTTLLPTQQFETAKWPGLKNIALSDPQLNRPGKIDVLLGADVYAAILLEGLHKHGSLIAQNSRLGWLVSGSTKSSVDIPTHNITVTTTLIEIDHLLRKFWEVEENPKGDKKLTALEQQCENHYMETHSRKEDGRYEVYLPFKEGQPQNLGDSRPMAVKRLLHMEKRFTKDPAFKEDYRKFLQQYEIQGHMAVVPDTDKMQFETDKNMNKYYLPHHGVMRQTSTSTKLRVVFDGSAKPMNGNSLNEELLIGPPLQQDLRDLITRWRQHRICLVADVQNMYRQIKVASKDTNYQRILWRENSHEPIREYKLLTVTYGTSCAPYLAIKTLHQLSDDERHDFPEESRILKTDVYMDDILTGTSQEDDAVQLRMRLTELFARGGFPLHKWASNSKMVLNEIPEANKISNSSVSIKLDETIKALGVTWNPNGDEFELKILVDSQCKPPYTKRAVLSLIAKVFDPLGWLAPIVIVLKVFMQKLWQAGLDWDDELPKDLNLEWHSYLTNLKTMNCINLPRWLGISGNCKLELHGFSDASSAAYAGVVYLRVLDEDNVVVRLIGARTKVAPVKQISVPRLELSGAVLLANLLNNIKTSLNIPNHCIFAWTDSTIVLAWLRKAPNTWKTFVGNRTTEILNILNSSQWRHVNSHDNPADCASRGITPKQLENFELWWNGPAFLKKSEIPEQTNNVPDVILERRHLLPVKVYANNVIENSSELYLKRYSRLSKLIRITALLLRFVKNCKAKINVKKNLMEPASFPQYLTVHELKRALNICIRLSQRVYFAKEIKLLREGQQIPNSNTLKSLVPFIDDEGILRATGRLKNALIKSDQKTPILLAHNCHFTLLLVQDIHIQALHGGPQLTLNILRNKYWVIGAKTLIKRVIRNCLTCFKHSASPVNQLMGQLPPSRVRPGKPFRCSGVDYAGPVILKLYPGRCQKTCKAYICLFICTVTKAIHLELVSDLSTNSFLAAFRRFTSRRGHCSDLWSDCATNFVGASAELDRMFKNRNSRVIGEIVNVLANDHTNWHFIPPGSPHFGGLWEAGVRSVKNHLKRVIGETRLTFEEYMTLLTQVEACVNSRPLTLLSSSIDDASPITPGHFLIGEAPITVPEINFEDISSSHLDRWQLLQKMLQHLWSRWSSEYLCTLQNRYKWSQIKNDVEIGTIVLVKDERLPPGKWLLARIIKKHPGKDDLTRVVTLRMKDKIFQRPITKICPLPLEDNIYN